MMLPTTSHSPSPSPAPSNDADAHGQEPSCRSTLVSRNVTISGHRTSIRLEPDMWSALTEICRREGGSLHEVCSAVASRKDENTSLTAAIRVFVMAYFRAAATEEGHTRAGHGFGMQTIMAQCSGNDALSARTGMAGAGSAQPTSLYGTRLPFLKTDRGGLR